MAKGNPPVGRVKAKFGDGRMQTFKLHDGTSKTDKFRTVASIWRDERGMSMSFEGDLGAAVTKALGGKPGERIFFNVYLDEPKAVPAGGGTDDSDWG